MVTTYDQEAHILHCKSGFSLPDPATVGGRSHLLVNADGVNVTVASVGATPFSIGGVLTATATLAPGRHQGFRSDGTHWVATDDDGRAFYAASAVSDASGNATFSFPAGVFSSPPKVAASLQAAASNQPIDYRIVTLTATQCVVNVRQSPVLVVLSLSVLGVSAPLAGATVHLFATPAGTTP